MKNYNPYEKEQIPEEMDSWLFFIISASCFAVGAVLFGISFAIKGAGVYLLFASMITELAAVTFLNAQKRHGYKKWFLALRIASYAVMGAALAIVLFGMAATAK